MFDMNTYLESGVRQVDGTLDRLLPPETTEPRRLHQAMRYSVFAPGKRLRPVLCLAAAEAAGGNRDAALIPAAAVEILHTYTLIHDDLPAMDDDDLRRGRPTCHIAFDEATAILAGDALLTRAFGILCETECCPPYSPADLVSELAGASGSTGVIGGQMADIEGEEKPLTIEQLVYIHTHKTGDLIRAAVRLGAMTAGVTGEQLAALTRYAEKIGLAFQIADDVLNATATREHLGKSAGTDAAAGKMTYVAAYGINGAREKAATLIAEAKKSLATLPGTTEPLSALADYVVNRNK
jgi:geranylgeranyl diphosphate synthase, type II